MPPGSLNVEGKTSGRGSILVKGQKVEFDVPPGWEILCQSLPRRETVSERSTEQLAKGSLENPIGSKRIQDLANPTSSVAIMVDDDTRPTPVREVLPVVLKVLEDAKVPRENIDIIIAVGTHPPMPGEKLERRLGTHILKNYRVTNHDSWAPDLVRVGQVGDIEIRINPIVARADLRIGIGSNLPHPFAGFGGGPKIAMPGICGYDTIREHHTSTLMEQGSYLGRVAGNPFYEFIRRASEMLGLDYVIDCVLDSDGRAVAIFSGHPLEAHEAGIRTCREIYGLEIDEQADVTIASAYPHEEGPQIMKPILPAVMATRRGGTLILVASCEGGLAEPFLEMFDLVQSRNPGNPMKTVLEHMRARKAFVPKSPMDFNCAIQVTIACLREINVIIVSENVTEAEASRIGFRHARDLERAIQMARDTYGRAKVSVFAAGGIVLPLVQKEVDLFGSETV
ncbi:MAG: nickel-dependent lactate racemase [Proteobacteria bacterium]|nr:nickel-dependent lactate racemase [Pseudomonadota bacterium]